MPLRAHFGLGFREHAVYKFFAVNASVPRGRLRENFPYEIEEGSPQIPQRRDWEIALRTIDNLSRNKPTRSFLQDVFASAAYLQPSGNACSKFDQVVVEKGYSGFQPECHAHVVYPFDGIINQHDLCIELENFVDGGARANVREEAIDKCKACVF